MNTIAIINQKGGVGKSTTALALGTGLVQHGYRVLFVDLDAQGNLSYTMGVDGQTISVMDVLQQVNRVGDAIQQTPHAALIASAPSLAGADAVITTTGKEYRLREALAAVDADYDYCIIDTPPALGILTINALTACQGVIIPAQADVYSLQGISQLYDTIETVRRYCNPAITVYGIVLTRYSARAIISRDITELIEQTASHFHTKLYKTKIRECTAIKESQATKQSIYAYAPKSNAALDYNALLDEILGKETEHSEENL